MSIRKLAKHIHSINGVNNRVNIPLVNRAVDQLLLAYKKTENGMYLARRLFKTEEVPESTIMESVYRQGKLRYFPVA